MLVVERRLSSRTRDISLPAVLDSNAPLPSIIVTQDDIELRERQRELPEEVLRDQPPPASQPTRAFGPHQRRIYLFTFAFIFHQITAGIGLGYGAAAPPWKPAETAGGDQPELSLPGPVTVYILGLVGEGMVHLRLSRAKGTALLVTHARESSCSDSRVRDDAPLGVPPGC